MLYIFTIKERVLGVSDYEHLKENAKKIWNESSENGEENEVNEEDSSCYETPVRKGRQTVSFLFRTGILPNGS